MHLLHLSLRVQLAKTKLEEKSCLTVILWCGSVRFSAVQCGLVQFSAVQCGSVRFSAVQCGSVRFSAVQCGSVQFSAVVILTDSIWAGKVSFTVFSSLAGPACIMQIGLHLRALVFAMKSILDRYCYHQFYTFIDSNNLSFSISHFCWFFFLISMYTGYPNEQRNRRGQVSRVFCLDTEGSEDGIRGGNSGRPLPPETTQKEETFLLIAMKWGPVQNSVYVA